MFVQGSRPSHTRLILILLQFSLPSKSYHVTPAMSCPLLFCLLGLSLLSPLCLLYKFISLRTLLSFSIFPTAPVSFPTAVFHPSLCHSLLTSLLSSTHSPRNKCRDEDPYWIIVFAISLQVDSVIAFIHQGLCKPDPANPAFACPLRILDDLYVRKLRRFSGDGEMANCC